MRLRRGLRHGWGPSRAEPSAALRKKRSFKHTNNQDVKHHVEQNIIMRRHCHSTTKIVCASDDKNSFKKKNKKKKKAQEKEDREEIRSWTQRK
jgi:hypothetical protein